MRVLCPNKATLSVGDRITTSTRAVFNVHDGAYVGTTNAAESYAFYIGNKAGTVGIVNLFGGETRGGTGDNIWVGVAGSGELNVSGGTLYVDKTLVVGGNATTDSATSVFRQTSGDVYAGDGVQVCGNSNGGASNNRACDVFLDGGILEASNIYGGGGRGAVGGTAARRRIRSTPPRCLSTCLSRNCRGRRTRRRSACAAPA